MGLNNPRDRAPVSVTTIRTLTGSGTLEGATDTNTIDLGAIPVATGFFTGRIKATGIDGSSALTVGWGCASFPRKQPIFIDNEIDDFAVNNFQRLAAFSTSNIDDGREYIFHLTDPDDPKPLPLIPEGETLQIYLNYTGTAGDDVSVDVVLDCEMWTDRAAEVA